MCQRMKPKGSQSWEPYNGPVIWSEYGDKGQDGDGFEYIYYLQDSLTPPDNPTPQDWYENTNYQNNIEGMLVSYRIGLMIHNLFHKIIDIYLYVRDKKLTILHIIK